MSKARSAQIRLLKIKLREASQIVEHQKRQIKAKSKQLAESTQPNRDGARRSQSESGRMAELQAQLGHARLCCHQLETELDASQAERISLTAKLQVTRGDRDQAKLEFARRVADMAARLEEAAKQALMLKNRYARDLQKLAEQHCQKVRALQSHHARELESLKAAFRSEFAEFKNRVRQNLSQARLSGLSPGQSVPRNPRTEDNAFGRPPQLSIATSLNWWLPVGQSCRSQAQVSKLQDQIAFLQRAVGTLSKSQSQPQSQSFSVFDQFLVLADWVRQNTPQKWADLIRSDLIPVSGSLSRAWTRLSCSARLTPTACSASAKSTAAASVWSRTTALCSKLTRCATSASR